MKLVRLVRERMRGEEQLVDVEYLEQLASFAHPTWRIAHRRQGLGSRS
jgi:hypothetical protein